MASGKTVTVSEKSINFNGWKGSGYIIVDPNTGSGAYMISGGANGGEIQENTSNAYYSGLVLGGLIGLGTVFISIWWVALLFVTVVLSLLIYNFVLTENEQGCFIGGGSLGAGITGLASASLIKMFKNLFTVTNFQKRLIDIANKGEKAGVYAGMISIILGAVVAGSSLPECTK